MDHAEIFPEFLQKRLIDPLGMKDTTFYPDPSQLARTAKTYGLKDGKLVEVIELADHPFFLASQFHPEFLSKPHQPHPLFKGFIAAALRKLHQKPP